MKIELDKNTIKIMITNKFVKPYVLVRATEHARQTKALHVHVSQHRSALGHSIYFTHSLNVNNENSILRIYSLY